DNIVSSALGNPLLLLELASDLTPAQLRGADMLPVPLPIGAHLRDIFLRRVKSLSSNAQSLLLLAAADPSGDPSLLLRAAEHMGLSRRTLNEVERSRLLLVGTQVLFRHPLIRSAVYHGSPVRKRRQVHEALANASDPFADPDRKAWHRAAATVGADEGVARDLELAP